MQNGISEVQDCADAIQSAIAEGATVGGRETKQRRADLHMQSADSKIVHDEFKAVFPRFKTQQRTSKGEIINGSSRLTPEV
jgi:hypothetical protein